MIPCPHCNVLFNPDMPGNRKRKSCGAKPCVKASRSRAIEAFMGRRPGTYSPGPESGRTGVGRVKGLKPD